VRDQRDVATISRTVQVSKGCLAARMDQLLADRFTYAGNLRLAKHLRRNQNALFVFFERDDLEATNWPAEYAIRPVLVNRKSCGGSRTSSGPSTQAVLMSLLRTRQQRNVKPLST
jgi:hypothetical protein